MIEKTRQTEVEMRLEELVQDARPGAFLPRARNLAIRLVQGGYSREELIEVFEGYRTVLRDRGQEDLEDDLLDVMDQLDGWCAEHVRI
jgi:hypothetical protein